jgi:NADH dehydrogenase
MKILVAGATGLLGGEICRQLAAAGHQVQGLVRQTADPAKVAGLKEAGVSVVQGDLRDRASLAAACQGVRAIISTVSSMPMAYEPGVNDIQSVDQAGQIDLIDAARAAGVGHFVYTSFSGNLDADFPLRNAKRRVELYHLAA